MTARPGRSVRACERRAHNWVVSALMFSIMVSVVLTVLLNAALRLFPGAARRAHDGLERLAERSTRDGRRSRVIVPWKAIFVASLVFTVVLNLVLFVVK